MVAATGATVISHYKARSRISRVDRGVKAGDVIKVGKTVELECLDTPGHTLCHICLFAHTEQPALFSGDTLFNVGAGNTHNGSETDAFHDTFAHQLARLPGHTRLYPGHDCVPTAPGWLQSCCRLEISAPGGGWVMAQNGASGAVLVGLMRLDLVVSVAFGVTVSLVPTVAAKAVATVSFAGASLPDSSRATWRTLALSPAPANLLYLAKVVTNWP